MSVTSVPSVLWHCWLGVRKSIRPVKKWVMGYWHGYLSRVWCKFAYGPADATATPSSLASVKFRMVYLSGAGLPRLSWKKAVKRIWWRWYDDVSDVYCFISWFYLWRIMLLSVHWWTKYLRTMYENFRRIVLFYCLHLGIHLELNGARLLSHCLQHFQVYGLDQLETWSQWCAG